MRALLVYPRTGEGQRPDYQYIFSLGLPLVAAALKTVGVSTVGLNLNHEEGSVEAAVVATMRRERPDVVCLGGLSPQFRQLERIVRSVRHFAPGTPLVLGGGVVTGDPEWILAQVRPDAVVIGEGERTVVELCRRWGTGEPLSGVGGLGFLDPQGTPVLNPRTQLIANLDELPLPDLELFGYRQYLDRHRSAAPSVYTDFFERPRPYFLLGSRSCPFRCTFCFNTVPGPYRQRSLGSLDSELRWAAAAYRPNVFLFYDELFSVDRARVLGICTIMKGLRNELDWPIVWNCTLRVSDVDPELLSEMADSGCAMVSYGLESADDRILKSMNKKTSANQVERAVRLTIDAGLRVDGNVLVGDPAEDHRSAAATMAFWKRYAEWGVNLDIVRPYPGSALYSRAMREDRIPDLRRFLEGGCEEETNLTEMDDDEYLAMVARLYVLKISHWRYCRGVLEGVDGEFTVRTKCPFCGAAHERRRVVLQNSSSFRIPDTCSECGRVFAIASRAWLLRVRLLRLVGRWLKRSRGLALLRSSLPV